MNRFLSIFAFAALGSFAPSFVASAAEAPSEKPTAFDADWRFTQGDVAEAQEPTFDDSAWHQLDLPHDWSIAGPFDEKNLTGGAGAFLPSDVAWYRKSFTLPTSAARRRMFVEFDGVMENSDVWINGAHLGHRPSGYVSFRYELTGHLEIGAGKTNVLAVRADTSAQPASRWYSGGGIYRHVRLVVTEPVHLEYHGTFVTTPKISTNAAIVHVQASVSNQSDADRDVSLRLTILDASGHVVKTAATKPQSLAAGQPHDFHEDLEVKNPELWNLDRPALYRAVVDVRAADVTLDTETITFGIRDARFEPATGFWLNGKNIKIKGVCLHHDGSAFGAAVPLRVWERRLEILRALGTNAIRTAHNPPSPEFLDLCDRLGFLVMDEMFDCWTVAKNPHDYHLFFNEWSERDTRDTVRRDRNHPSIILYSAGNEIHDTPKEELAKKILTGLVKVFHDNDPTRPVTQALFRPNVSHDYDNGLADLLDVVGTNYRDAELLAAGRAKPSRKLLGTEQRHDRETWLHARDNPQHAGQFLWTGIDYLGESRKWPVMAAGSGLLDRTGEIRALGFERQSWWSTEPMVHITRRIALDRASPTDPGFDPLDRRQTQFSDWTPVNSAAHEETVEAYSNCEQVELFLNGQSLGGLPLPANAAPRTWKIPYAPGALKAVASNQGRPVATHELRTAGAAARILLTVDRPQLSAAWDDIATLTAIVVDEHGVRVPGANQLVTFAVAGPGAIVAVDSGDNSSHEPFQADARRAWQGRCLAFAKTSAPNGRLTVTASAPGLGSGEVTIDAVAPSAQKNSSH